MNSSYTNVRIETDLEPDDVLALRALPVPMTCVVGEGDAAIKVTRMHRYAKLLYPLDSQPEILQGMGSKVKFPADGKEFKDLEVGNAVAASKVQSDYFTSFEVFATEENPIMFSLKPMRELITMYRSDTSKTTALLANVTLYAYGSFNFRCIIDKTHGSADLENLLSAFKRVYLYEAYFAEAGNGNANASTMPALYSHIDAQCKIYDPFWCTLVRLIHLWNDHIKIQMASSNGAVAKNILARIADDDRQMVLADFGLAAMYWMVDPPGVEVERVTFHPDTRYTVPIMASHTVEDSTSIRNPKGEAMPYSKVFLYKGVSIKNLESILLEHLR